MADKQEMTSAEKQQQNTQKVEITVAPTNEALETPAEDNISQLTPEIMEALSMDLSQANEQELRSHNTCLQTLLGKVIILLKDKSRLCANLEKQNTALSQQSNSLKDVVAITKDLLSIRNTEVVHLHVDIKSLEEKINFERERHNLMLSRMSEAVKLNESLKNEYQTQLGLFTDLRARYEEKVAVLETENKRLSNLANGDRSIQQPEDGVQLSLDPITPP